MAHDKHVCGHGAEVGHCVQKRFAFGGRRLGNVQVDDISRQARCGNLKGGAGAGGVLKEQVEHAFSAKQRHFFNIAVVKTHKVGGGIENMDERRFGQAFNRQQVGQLAVAVQLGVALQWHKGDRGEWIRRRRSGGFELEAEQARSVARQTQ